MVAHPSIPTRAKDTNLASRQSTSKHFTEPQHPTEPYVCRSSRTRTKPWRPNPSHAGPRRASQSRVIPARPMLTPGLQSKPCTDPRRSSGSHVHPQRSSSSHGQPRHHSPSHVRSRRATRSRAWPHRFCPTGTERYGRSPRCFRPRPTSCPRSTSGHGHSSRSSICSRNGRRRLQSRGSLRHHALRELLTTSFLDHPSYLELDGSTVSFIRTRQ